jgi:hypothetical protein
LDLRYDIVKKERRGKDKIKITCPTAVVHYTCDMGRKDEYYGVGRSFKKC